MSNYREEYIAENRIDFYANTATATTPAQNATNGWFKVAAPVKTGGAGTSVVVDGVSFGGLGVSAGCDGVSFGG